MPSRYPVSDSCFVVEGLNVTASSTEALQHIEANIPQRKPEASTLCRGLLSRLKLIHDSVVALHPDDKSKVEYNRILVRFLWLLIKRPILVHLARSDANRIVLRGHHRRLDGVIVDLGVTETTDWEAEWETGCAQQREELKKLVSRSPFMLVNEVGGDKKLRETLMKLGNAANLTQDDELHRLRLTTLEKVLRIQGKVGMKIFNWFIAIEDIEYEDEAMVALGTFAETRRATWSNNGERQDVVAKTLFFNTDGEDEDTFLKQLKFWNDLPKHENVLELLGGSHVNSPPFFVYSFGHCFWTWPRDEPMELFDESASNEPRFETDIYALGMCMLEAITQEIPYGMIEDEKATELILAGELPTRPDQVSDEVWDLICTLCAVDYRASPSLDKIIDIIASNEKNQTPLQQSDSNNSSALGPSDGAEATSMP
ncbi:hypothetical protein PC129_g9352 [Phytophthora cactorum]|uniref:Protein kinase domain-containing protein n=1 Tax=Phytophthora cactorum TaxID=29920 RepID=A0A329SJ61_9STRA|nr:hypothetical protein Pcac1_g18663 [Phytophthora cactorum]KAG2837353.1 hypothetical protein PC112_g4949 [Phytophthora cactorum]KAG2856319.1 hypothetical protein PC113_g11688 [Phytophthora cactorum]KAG2903830.1 hypothetical protein PC114_g12103 [Phytophthora cactorum]KAG2918935.1 hypothetical protein PC115_g10329 [Phytophthora cactorum]